MFKNILKKHMPLIITAAVLAVAIILTMMVVPSDRFKKPQGLDFNEYGDEFGAAFKSGMLICGGSEAPYTAGDLLFFSQTKGVYRYRDYGEGEQIPEITAGYDASSWDIVSSDGIISGTDAKDIAVVSTDEYGRVKEYAHFTYVPGVIYGLSNADQYDDLLLYNSEEPSKEDERAIRLASNLFKSGKSSYYNTGYGAIIQGFLSKYSVTGGMLEGYYHTGVDFLTVNEKQPFYSPVSGRITHASGEDDYNMIIIYNEQYDVSVIILHAWDIAPAKAILEAGGEVKTGDHLGYGGGKGNPVGDTHLHLELRRGKVERYKSFSKEVVYTRMTNYDPLILADWFNLEVLPEDGFEPFSKVKSDSFDAQNNASAVLAGNWLYYIDKVNGSALYKARPDGTETQVLVASNCANLSYYDGWLYYTDVAQGGHVMRTSSDGSQTQLVAAMNSEYFLYVHDDWVYLSNPNERNSVYRVRHDGSELARIINRDVSDVFYTDGFVYYTQDASYNGHRVYRLDLSSMQLTQTVQSRVDKPFVYEGRLCYRRFYSDKNCLSLPQDVFDEGQAQVFIPAAYDQVIPGEKYIIFTNTNDANSIYVLFEGKPEPVKLTSDVMCSDLTVQGGWLYYYTPTEGANRLSRINIYGMKKQRLTPEGVWSSVTFDAEEGFDGIVLASRTGTEFPTPIPDMTPIVSETPVGITPYPTETPLPTMPPELGDNTPAPEETPVASNAPVPSYRPIPSYVPSRPSPSYAPQTATPAVTPTTEATPTVEATPTIEATPTVEATPTAEIQE